MAGRRGRPPLDANLVDDRDGDSIAKLRWKLLLETMYGGVSLSEAAEVLGVKERAVLKLRQR